ncbi:MAG TPA: DUF2207 domain-containing protein [Candidatus Angelobacter sp.]
MPRLKLNKLSGCLLVLVCLAVFSAAQDDTADERILSFDSHITLHADGTMLVRETIQVRAAGEQINHGIYRDFPTRYKDRLGNRVTVMFEVGDVQRDGHAEPYHTESISNGVRVYFGDKDVLVSHGIHTYVLTYETNRQLGFFPDHDELYWNVTGNGWIFPIDVATATVVLPPQITFITGVNGYAGREGERGKDVRASRDSEGNPHFRAENLGPKEGLTIAVTWPKGLIAEPTRAQKIKWFLSDNRSALIGIIGLLVVLAYYAVVWAEVGRDPKAGTIVPLYEPPDNMSPASMRYLERMGFDDKTFTSAILGLAAKKHLTIEQMKSGTYRLIEKSDANHAAPLSSDERMLKERLFEDGETLALSSDHSAVMRKAQQALSTALHTGMEKTYFVTNSRYVWPGIALTIASALAVIFSSGGPSPSGQLAVAIFMTVWLSGWSVGVAALLHAVVRAWKSARASKAVGGVSAVGITLFSIPFVLGEIFGICMLAWALSPVGMLMILLLLGANVLFHHLLKAPTLAGRQLMDRVDGFKMFLSAVDGQRMNTMMPVGQTPELFERFLPYALALGVEQAWAEQFSHVLATVGAPGHESATYSPSWYSGGFIGSSPAAFASSFSSAFSSAVSSASTPPGSSSGGGGGGSSGGGGGGGGGGGW